MANPVRWIYDQARNAYNRVRGRSSQTLSQTEMIDIRNEYGNKKADFAASMAVDLFDGNINIQQWTLQFRDELKRTYINQYMSGRGGVNNMTQADWGSIGGQLRNQYRYMNDFAAQIARGDLSAAQIEARMKLYFNSSTQAYERGQSASVGLSLPQYPGDGQTQCRTNCKCEWVHVEFDDRIESTWTLNPAEHCPDCVRNSQTWNPLVTPR